MEWKDGIGKCKGTPRCDAMSTATRTRTRARTRARTRTRTRQHSESFSLDEIFPRDIFRNINSAINNSSAGIFNKDIGRKTIVGTGDTINKLERQIH